MYRIARTVPINGSAYPLKQLILNDLFGGERVGFGPSRTLKNHSTTQVRRRAGRHSQLTIVMTGDLLYLFCTCSWPFDGIDGIDTTCFAVSY